MRARGQDPPPRARAGGFPPTRKSLGQHFLTDRRALDGIVEALQLTGTETVVEIGPGRGALTDRLAARLQDGGRLVAVEVDRALAAMLRDRYAARSHVSIIEADVLEVSLRDLAGVDDFVLVGNVPYYITTPILFHALRRPRAMRAVYLVQKEVAERIGAEPGTREYGALSVNVQAVASAEVVFRVPPSAFRPPPKVDSAVIRVVPRSDPVVAAEEEEPLRRFVQAAFAMRRKQMRRVVRSVWGVEAEVAEAALAAADISPDVRPETLPALAFARLLRARPA